MFYPLFFESSFFFKKNEIPISLCSYVPYCMANACLYDDLLGAACKAWDAAVPCSKLVLAVCKYFCAWLISKTSNQKIIWFRKVKLYTADNKIWADPPVFVFSFELCRTSKVVNSFWKYVLPHTQLYNEHPIVSWKSFYYYTCILQLFPLIGWNWKERTIFSPKFPKNTNKKDMLQKEYILHVFIML